MFKYQDYQQAHFFLQSFYLPGSVDNEHNQVEQWNLKPPPLYLWSRRDWAQLHREIANKHSHLSEEDYIPDEELNAKTKAIPNQLYGNSSEEDEENSDAYKQNPNLLLKEPEVAELLPAPPLTVHSFMEAGGKIDNKEHDPCEDLDSLSDMSMSSPETDVKSCLRGQDHRFNAGLAAGPSTTQFGSSNPFGYWGAPGFGGWLD